MFAVAALLLKMILSVLLFACVQLVSVFCCFLLFLRLLLGSPTPPLPLLTFQNVKNNKTIGETLLTFQNVKNNKTIGETLLTSENVKDNKTIGDPFDLRKCQEQFFVSRKIILYPKKDCCIPKKDFCTPKKSLWSFVSPKKHFVPHKKSHPILL